MGTTVYIVNSRVPHGTRNRIYDSRPPTTAVTDYAIGLEKLSANRKFFSLVAACKLQALVYDILPPTTAVTDYAIGLEKLSANGQFFVGAQIAVSV